MQLVLGHTEFMRRRGLAEETINIRRRRLTMFDREVGIVTATGPDIEAFLDLRRGRSGDPLTPKARYDWISHLHKFYGWAVDFEHLPSDPTRQVVRPRVRQGLPRPITTADLAIALDMATPMMRTWLSLMAFNGLRCIEVARLEVDGLLWGDRLLRIFGKGDKERLVPMHSEVARLLELIPRPKRGRVFQRPRGGGYPAAQVSAETNAYLDSLGIAATAHQLRHWFGTNLYRVCRDLRVVQEMMGHASPATTAIYVDWSRNEAYAAIGALSLDRNEPSLFTDWPVAS